MNRDRIMNVSGFTLLVMGWLALTIGLRPLTIPDEGRYVSVAWEMLASGNWLYPTINGLPFFHKPPLFYWITASSLALFGNHEWASRLVSLLGAAIGLLSLYGFLLRKKGDRLARWTLLILVTQPFFYIGAQFANLDMLVAGFISATIILASEAVLNSVNGQPYKLLLAASYLCAALGLLSKGLIGIALPGLVIVLWLVWNRQIAQLRKLVWLPGITLFVLVAAPWFAAMQSRFPDFLNYFFIYNHIERFVSEDFNNHQPFWFYIPVVLILTLPWSWWLREAWKNRRTGTEAKPSIRSLMWIWPVVIIGFFSIPSSKTIGYVLPSLYPLAYLVAEVIERKHLANPTLSFYKKLLFISAIVCVLLVVAYSVFNTKTDKDIGRLIAAQRQSGEPVVFLDYQFYDLPFYLSLQQPAMILNDWNPKIVDSHDNWAKALADSGKFDPASASRLLLDDTQLITTVCSAPQTWVIARKGMENYPALLKSRPVFAGNKITVAWKLRRDELVASGICPSQTPNGDSTGK